MIEIARCLLLENMRQTEKKKIFFNGLMLFSFIFACKLHNAIDLLEFKNAFRSNLAN